MAQGFTRGTPIDTDPNLALDSDLVVPSQKAIKDYVDTGLSNKVNRSGDTMAGNLILNTNPTLPLQAATKDYVDTLINGLDWKQAADAGTVAALPAYTVTGSGQILTGNVNGAIPSATTDGVTLTANQRLLVKNETSTLTPNNGIYVVTQVGSGSLPFILTRSADANTSALLSEATLGVKNGTTLANTQWHCNPAAIPIIIGTTNITFAQIGGGNYTFSPPLAVAGNIVSIPPATSSVDGYLTSSDHLLFSGKQDALNGNGFVTASGTTITYDNSTYVPTSTSVSTTNSLSGGGALSSSLTLQLVNDSASPGNDKVYGTDSSGTKGWYNAATGGGITALTGDVAASGTGPVVATLASNLKTGSCGVTFDGGGQVVQNKTAYVQMPYNGTLGAWFMVADQGGACTITVYKGTFGTFPTSSPVYATAPAIPATNQKALVALPTYNSGMATVTAGDVLKFEISSVTSITWVNLSISIAKT
jgi:hypothetical protein